MARLTKKLIDQTPGTDTEQTLNCGELRGFRVRIAPISSRYPKGKRTYVVRCYVQGRERKIALGNCEAVSIEVARRRAREILGVVASGQDPRLADQQAAARCPQDRVLDLVDRYIHEHLASHAKPRSLKEAERLLRVHVVPTLGSLPIKAVTRDDVETLHKRIGRETPVEANRVLTALSAAFQWAEAWGLRLENTNPCRSGRAGGIVRFRERKVERFLAPTERQRLLQTLDTIDALPPRSKGWVGPAYTNLFRLLVTTGARLDEIRTLRWRFVDFDHGCLRLPESKTNEKTILLSHGALSILKSLPKEKNANALVLSTSSGKPLYNVQRSWETVRRFAKLDGSDGQAQVRIHDLRHSFVSNLIRQGVPLHVAGQLVGHRAPQTTARYAHLADKTLRDAVNKADD